MPGWKNVACDAFSVTWSAHHASHKIACYLKRVYQYKYIVSLLMTMLTLLLLDIRHIVDKVCNALAFINPRQNPAVTADQHWTLTQSKFVIIIGWFLIELAVFRLTDTQGLDSCNNTCTGGLIWYNRHFILHECYHNINSSMDHSL